MHRPPSQIKSPAALAGADRAGIEIGLDADHDIRHRAENQHRAALYLSRRFAIRLPVAALIATFAGIGGRP